MNSNEIVQLLPEVYRRAALAGSPLMALLEVMEQLQTPVEKTLEMQHESLSAYQSSEDYLPMLARFVDIDRFISNPGELDSYKSQVTTWSIETGRIREMIQAAPTLSKLRGTLSGLKMFLETATGEQGFKLIETGNTEKLRPFHVGIYAPAGTKIHQKLIEQIVEQEKPAFVTHTVIWQK